MTEAYEHTLKIPMTAMRRGNALGKDCISFGNCPSGAVTTVSFWHLNDSTPSEGQHISRKIRPFLLVWVRRDNPQSSKIEDNISIFLTSLSLVWQEPSNRRPLSFFACFD
jgi:hypothetical protein